MPTVDTKDSQDRGAGGYDGIKAGMKRATGTTLDTNPAMMDRLSGVGWRTAPDRSEEMPKTAPLCNSRPAEP